MNKKLNSSSRAASALVITLLIMVILCGLVLAYFSQTIINRKISFSSAGQERAQAVGECAMKIVTGDLQAEMASGSVTNTVSGVVIMNPKSPHTMIPYPTGMLSGMTNLVKWSAGGVANWPSSSFYASGGPVRASVGNVTTSPSANGRYIDISRWSLPQLGTNGTASATPPWPPSWVILTRQGPLNLPANGSVPSNQLAALADSAATNSSYAIGRFAYTVYDEGGLIDVAAAGAPSNTPTYSAARKGILGYADLTQLGLSQAQADALVAWRNPASSSSYTNYLQDFAPRYGFLRAAQGDQAFLGRQDLINFCTQNFGAQAASLILPNLTTFTRENNAPSWGPVSNASDLGGNNDGPDLSTTSSAPISGRYAYRDNADMPTSTNRFFPQVRVAQAFTRLDGTTALPGEPLVKTRFDLNKLSWIKHDGSLPPGVTSADVLNYFGLNRNSDGSWTYNHGSSTHIMTLDEVANANREPDFFEILKAGLIQGGLGWTMGDPTQPKSDIPGGEFSTAALTSWGSLFLRRPETSAPNSALVHAVEKYHVIQIGANLIDQVQPDAYPTEIILNGQSFYGIQNLPYINAIGIVPMRPTPGTTTPPLEDTFEGFVHQWLTFSLWNPHQNAMNAPVMGPQKFRIYISDGELAPCIWDLAGIKGAPVPGPANHGVKFQSTVSSAPYQEVGPSWLAFELSNYTGKFAEPTPIDYSNSNTDDPTGGPNINNPRGRVSAGNNWSRAGIYLGWSLSLYYYVPANMSGYPHENDKPYYIPDYKNGVLTGSNKGQLLWTAPLTIHLQYYDTQTSTWRDYQVLRRFAFTSDAYGVKIRSNPDIFSFSESDENSDYEGWQVNLLDPRCVRGNIFRLDNSTGGLSPRSNFYGRKVAPNKYGNPPLASKDWVFNDSSAGQTITDRDGVVRVGDGSRWGSAANPLAPANANRPIMLNRPFQSVAEIGYTFRDQPWKTLNLSSSTSADSPLLDLFCIGSTSAGNTPPPAIVAGKVNINSAPISVLKSLIMGANRDAQLTDSETITSISSTDAETLSAAITNYIAKTGPLQNLAQVPAIYPQDSTINPANPGFKIRREGMVRALTGSAGVRTWNLLIDIIAQSGRYKSNTSNLNDFVVEGEKRYWLHVAIDRFTGQVLDQTVEPVYEW